MATIGEEHRAKCGGEGKCSVPMFDAWGPSGFCDRPAWGERYSERDLSRNYSGRHAPPHWPHRDRNGYYPAHLAHATPPYAPGYCCPAHAGPGSDDIRFVRDGDMWCAFMPDFENLQESPAGFGETQDQAEAGLDAARTSTTKGGR